MLPIINKKAVNQFFCFIKAILLSHSKTYITDPHLQHNNRKETRRPTTNPNVEKALLAL